MTGFAPFARLEAWFGRRCARLNSAEAWARATWLVPLLFGLLSVLLGQDDNWDLRNYHLYNPFAVLHGRIGFDIAPGHWQSYFNPTLDFLYYGLVTYLPGPLAGFVMGALHGLNFLLLLAIAAQLLDRLAPAQRHCVPLLLAVCGVCGAGFLAQLGSSMGDNMTALLILSSVLILLRGWEALQAPRGGNLVVLAAGLVMGLGTGLKLTNATFATGLCLALFTVPVPWRARLRLAFLFGVAVLAGIAVTAGWWFVTMWQTFGNPLFPQFNNIFKSPLALAYGVIDDIHVPKTLGEALAWPFVFTLHYERVSELKLRQLIWPVVYLLGLALAGRMLWRRGGAALPPRERFLLVFFFVSYVAWMKLFGIYRYLIAVELLAPLVAWVLLHALLSAQAARRAAAWALAACTLVVFPFSTWGHSDWAWDSFRADVPAFAQPEQTVLVAPIADPPLGWLVERFPRQIRVVSVDGFPETPAWVARIEQAMDDRRGPHYALLSGAVDDNRRRLAIRLALAERLGLMDDEKGCRRLAWLLTKVRQRVQVVPAPAGTGHACTLETQPQYRIDVAQKNAEIVRRGGEVLARYGLRIEAGACTVHDAFTGAEAKPYQLCPVARTQTPP